MRSTALACVVAAAGAAYALAQAPAAQPTPTGLPAPAGVPAVPDDRGTATVTINGKAITIEYGRPTLRGRDPLKMAEVGRRWRMGKDGATTLNTQGELAFGEVKVAKGSYILTATRVAADQWHLNFNDKDRKKIAAVPLTIASVDPAVEIFTIELKEASGGGVFSMAWGTVSLSASFTAS